MRRIYFKAIPYIKEEVTLALEAGVDGLIVPDAMAESAGSLARVEIFPQSRVRFIALEAKEDEEEAARLARIQADQHEGAPSLVVLEAGWEIIPLENLLASSSDIAVEVRNQEEALVAAGVLERGANILILCPEALAELKDIVAAVKYAPEKMCLESAVITRIEHAGMGHRVCVDTMSIMHTGQGMLVGNSAAFTFLVNAETERNEYVAARPFRINAGGVHAYAVLPQDRTAYLDELSAGSEVLITAHTGETFTATVGRVKVERRPMLLLEAEVATTGGSQAKPVRGTVFLQNAETIRLVSPEGRAVSVVDLKEGDRVLCRLDVAGRHFGMRITEDIKEG